MNNICRLCLSVNSEVIHNLYENSEIMLKIASCLQVEILYDNSLPNQICLQCNERIDQMHTFLKSVHNNQNILKYQLKLGIGSLENFYSSLKSVKDENKDNTLELLKDEPTECIQENKDNTLELLKDEPTECIENLTQIEKPIKHEENFEGSNDYSSDDNITLKSLIETKRKSLKAKSQYKPKNKVKHNRNKRNVNVTGSLKTNPETTEIKENIVIDSSRKSTEFLEMKCLTCFKIFGTRQKLNKHYQMDHRPSVPIECDTNNYSTVEEGGNVIFMCGMCEKTYPSKKRVKGHIQHKHQESRPYICNLCGRTYKTTKDIIQHLRAHNGIVLSCSHNCGYSSAYSGALRSHEKRHTHDYKYKCSTCGKGFDVKTWYDDHQNIHTGAKPFACNECGLAYHFRKYLVRHQTVAHPDAQPPADKPRYVCVQCSQPHNTKLALKKHMATEHGIKFGFLCDTCGKYFKTSSKLTNHKKYHLGVKNHTCSTCSKSFTTRGALRRHELTHAGFRRHACADCGKRYAHIAALRKHQHRHHSAPVQKCNVMNE